MKNDMVIGVKQRWVAQTRCPPSSMPFACSASSFKGRRKGREEVEGGQVLSSATGSHADRVSTAPYLGATLYSLKRKFMGQNNSSLNIGLLLLPWLGRVCSTLGNMDSSKLSKPNLRYLKA